MNLFPWRRAKNGWPPCRWLVLRDTTHELLEDQMRLDWVAIWG